MKPEGGLKNVLGKTAGLGNFCLDVLFPVKCVSCGEEGEWVCRECLERIPLRRKQFCPRCEKINTPSGEACFSCRKKSPLAGLLVASHYKIKIVARLIHLFKYRGVEGISRPLGKIMSRSFLEFDLPLPDLIIPGPVSGKRLRERGYNQSALLARRLAEDIAPGFPIPVPEEALFRKKARLPQMKIKNYARRMLNVAGAFEPGAPEAAEKIKGKRILLVDDVATTGATLSECAKILKLAGAGEVSAIVIARQEINGS